MILMAKELTCGFMTLQFTVENLIQCLFFILFLDWSREFRKTLPREELTEEEKLEIRQKQDPPVKPDYSITKVIRHLKMNDGQSDLDARPIKRERGRDSLSDSEVLLVERNVDDDLKDHVDPDPDDLDFQEARLSQGELTKDEKKRWKRRYKGEAVYMVRQPIR